MAVAQAPQYQAFDPVAYEAKVREYMNKLSVPGGAEAVETEAQMAADQGDDLKQQIIQKAKDQAMDEAKQYGTDYFAGQAGAAGAGAGIGAGGGFLGATGATTAGSTAAGAAAAESAGIGAANAAGVSSGAIEALGASGAMPGAAGAEAATAAAPGAGIGAYAAPVAAVITAAMMAKNLMAAKKAARGSGGLTSKEQSSVYNPWGGVIKGSPVGKYIPKEAMSVLDWSMKYSPIGLGVKAIYGSGKNDDQIMRDRFRNTTLRDIGAIGPDKNQWDLTLADKSKFDVGKEGKEKLYNIDTTDALNAQIVPDAGLLSALLSGGDKKTTSDWGAYFANAARSNAGGNVDTARANLKSAVADYMTKNAGFTAQTATSNLDEMLKAGRISQSEHDVWGSRVGTYFGGGGASSGTGGAARSKTSSPGIDKKGRRIKY